MRVRAFTQDDAHIFCTEDQILEEVSAFISFLHEVYQDFGFTDVIYRLSTRPKNRVGSDESWDKSEKALADALDAEGLPWEELPGEGAFYGPKIEFSLKDCIGRVWQCGTMQVDFSMPGRLDASYVDENGEKQVPVMLHRALLGSFERFIGILIEQHEGKFPVWLAPIQAVVMNITNKQSPYVEKAVKLLQNSGLRVEADLRNEKIGFKIREWTLEKVPYLLVAGDREVENNQLAVRTREGKDLGVVDLESLAGNLIDEIASRGASKVE
jgi:threonyl-tRNA synthetase